MPKQVDDDVIKQLNDTFSYTLATNIGVKSLILMTCVIDGQIVATLNVKDERTGKNVFHTANIQKALAEFNKL